MKKWRIVLTSFAVLIVSSFTFLEVITSNKVQAADPVWSRKYSATAEYIDYGTQSPISQRSNISMDPNGIPRVIYPGNPTPQYNPGMVAMYGLQEWSYFILNTYSGAAGLTNAKNAADWLVANQRADGAWVYNFDSVVGGMGTTTMRAPWISAFSQGTALSLLERIYWKFNDQPYLDAAVKGLLPYQVDVSLGGIKRAHLSGAPDWYEGYPSTPPSYVLNEFIFGLLGPYDVSTLTAYTPQSATALQIFNNGVSTLKSALPYYETGGVSLYHLGHITLPPRQAYLSRSYHARHIILVMTIQYLRPDDTFSYYAWIWTKYQNAGFPPPSASS